MNAFDWSDRRPIKIDPDWKINLGRYGNIAGIQCSVDSDGYHFTCDRPPYGGATPNTAPSNVRALIDQENELDLECRGTPGMDPDGPICRQRNALARQLTQAGYCYGRPDDLGYQRYWRPCE